MWAQLIATCAFVTLMKRTQKQACGADKEVGHTKKLAVVNSSSNSFLNHYILKCSLHCTANEGSDRFLGTTQKIACHLFDYATCGCI